MNNLLGKPFSGRHSVHLRKAHSDKQREGAHEFQIESVNRLNANSVSFYNFAEPDGWVV